MSSGLKLVLPVTFTDTTLPVLYDDAVMSAGSLLLLDPMHSVNPWASGVPANGVTVPNIAWKTLSAILGAGDINSLALPWNYDAVLNTDAKMERSGKGALHVIWTQANASSKRAWFGMPSALNTYLGANPSHSIYFSRWSQITRAALSASPEVPTAAMVNSAAGATSNYLLLGNRVGLLPSGGSQYLGGHDTGANVVANHYESVGINGWTGTVETNWGSNPPQLCCWGYGHTAWTASNANKSRSSILYRTYMEDLTVSGRTYAQVDAIDYAIWQAAMASGGRYYGDTFTNPSTFP